MQKWEESIKTTLNNTKHSSAYLLHLLSMKEIHISISKLQISKKNTKLQENLFTSLQRKVLLQSQRHMKVYWTSKATEVTISAAVGRIYHTQHNSLLQTRASTEQLKKGFAELHLGPHLMSLTPWNCLFRAWLSAHSAFRKESSSSSSSFCSREGREAVRDTAWALLEQPSSWAPHNTYLQLLLLPVVVQHHLFLLFMTDHRLPPWSSLALLEGKLSMLLMAFMIQRRSRYTKTSKTFLQTTGLLEFSKVPQNRKTIAEKLWLHS